MFPIVADLEAFLVDGLDRGEIDLSRLVVVEEPPDFRGELIFQPIKGAEDLFYSRYLTWVSYRLVLSELYNLPAFVEQLTADGYQVVFGSSCAAIFADYARWAEPLEIPGYSLYGFQQFSLNRALEQRDWFFNWSTGCGKSFVQAAGARHLFDRGEIDLVIACTVTKCKINLARFYEKAGIDVVINDGTKAKRTRVYGERHQAYVANYEKLAVDYAQLEALCWGKRVLFCLDECTKILGAEKHNRARQAFERLFPFCLGGSKIWTFTASAVGGDPLRYRDLFSIGGEEQNPLGTHQQFKTRYADKIQTIDLLTAKGKRFPLTTIDWNSTRLQEVRHRVARRTHAARKSDPAIAALFPEMATVVEAIQLERDERKLSDAIVDRAWEAYQRGESMKGYYDLLRVVTVAPLALRHTSYGVGQELAADFGDTLDKIASSKVARLNEQLAEIRDQGDQCVAFCHWTTLGVNLIRDQLEVSHVIHIGTGQTAKESQLAQDRFKSDPSIVCFVTSDAGMMGLNLQNARYVVQLDPTYRYDDVYQRASRIHRSDSYLDGLTNYVYVAEDSVDERVWKLNLSGRLITESIQGTTEALNFGSPLTWADRERAQRTEAANLPWLLFGDRAK